jgi:lipoyl synthase
MKVWKLSAGTAWVIGKQKLKSDALPTTAYIMLGEKCRSNCGFCAQARESQAHTSLLSRITWPDFAPQDVVQDIAAAHKTGVLKRACLQVVSGHDSWTETLQAVDLLKLHSDVPVCVSSHIDSVDQAEDLMRRGAERICIALDAATPELYGEVKGGAWERRWDLLTQCASRLPNRVTTHLIVGLGESEMEMVRIMTACIERGITVGLFAFTPIRGTAMSQRQPPEVGHYRRIQIAHQILKKGYGQKAFVFDRGRITGCTLPVEELRELLADGTVFQTSGCADCNRPYYNERPGGIMYNYPRPLTTPEVEQAILASGLGEGIQL